MQEREDGAGSPIFPRYPDPQRFWSTRIDYRRKFYARDHAIVAGAFMSECIAPKWSERYSALVDASIDAVNPAVLAQINENPSGVAAVDHAVLTGAAMPIADHSLAQRGILPARWLPSPESALSMPPHAVFADALVEDHNDHMIVRVWSAIPSDDRLAEYFGSAASIR